MYRSRKDLLRRLDWLFSSNGGAETTDIELVLDSTTSSSLSSSTIATDSFNTNNNHDNPATQIIIPTHKCILVSISIYLYFYYRHRIWCVSSIECISSIKKVYNLYMKFVSQNKKF